RLGGSGAAEAVLDDTHLPALRSEGRHKIWLGSFGWRAEDRLLGHFKLAPLGPRPPVTLEVAASRRIDQPYDLTWSLDGYTSTYPDPSGDPFGTQGPGYSPTPKPGFTRYDAADHKTMTDLRSGIAVLGWNAPLARGTASASLGWTETRRVTSIGGRDDESYLDPTHFPAFGVQQSDYNEPIYIYGGDEPYFHKSAVTTIALRGDWRREFRTASRAATGLGGSYDRFAWRELDVSEPLLGLDSLRAFHAAAPGGFAYAQTRWLFQGLVLNAGARLEYFTAGHEAEQQSY